MKRLLFQAFERKSYIFIFIIIVIVAFVVIVRPYIPLKREVNYAANIAPKQKDLVGEKWIVTTTINAPTEDIKKLCNIDGWRTVVVGDTKTPKGWKNPPCIYLSIEKQLQLGYRITKKIPTRNYARKGIGYMFAIQHGAKYIYETDDDNHPTDNLGSFLYKELYEGLVYKVENRKVVNPYAHFGQPSIWPRGYPLSEVGAPITDTYTKCKMRTPIIQQGVVNGDPDVDAMFRLTRKNHAARIDVQFDPTAPVVVLPNTVMSPYNSQNTFHLYGAFWGLVLPHTVTFRITDIWRGYWVQSLLPLIGGTLSFFPPNAYQKRSAHDYIQDAIQEEKLYYQTVKLIAFIEKWTCGNGDFLYCAAKVAKDMAKEDFWKIEDAELIQAWIQDLKDVGYKPPKRISKTEKSPCKANESNVKFVPVEQKTSAAHTPWLGIFKYTK